MRIEETRPISKTKHWRLLEILDSREVAEVRPIELEGDAVSGLGLGDEEEVAADLDEDIDPDILDLLVSAGEDLEDGEDD